MHVSPYRVRLASRAATLAVLAGLAVLLTTGAEVAVSAGANPAKAKAPALFISTSGSDARSCRSRTQPCASFQRAYVVARPGQIVEVAGGSYAEQSLAGSRRRSGPNVVFRPAAGARVVLGGLSFKGAQRVTVRGMHTSYKGVPPGARNQEGIFVGPNSAHIRLEGMDAGSIDTWLANHVTVVGGDFGPCDAVWASSNVCGNSKLDVSTNITIDGALFHDYRLDDSCVGGDCHWECMYINGSENITIRNSRFRDCALFDIFVTISGPVAARMGHRNLTIENNWFDTPWTEDRPGAARARATAVGLAWCGSSPAGYRNVSIRFNSFQRNTGLFWENNAACVWDNIRVVGNLLTFTGWCDPRTTYAYNVWTRAIRTGRCAATDRSIGDAMPYVVSRSGRDFDFHLRARTTVADNFVPSGILGGCPRFDIDRELRSERRCDAGSDERATRR